PTDLVAAAQVPGIHERAIMCPTDGAAMDVLEAVRASGRDPRSVAVTGFDGYGPLAAPFLGLTTFRQPIEEMGRAAVDLLVDQLDEITHGARFVSLHGTVVPGRTATAPTAA